MPDLVDAEARLHFYADTIGVEPPAHIVCPEGAPTQALLDFCRRYGASLDWIFCGDMRALIRASLAVAQLERR